MPCLTILVDIIKLKLLMSELDVDDLETIEAIDSILDVVNNNLPKVSSLLTANRNSHYFCNRLMIVYS